MIISTLVVALSALASSSPTVLQPRQSFDSFIAAERQRSFEGVLANIGGVGSSLVPGAEPGMVVASPATVNPNYFYSWTRDSALTMTMLIDELILGNTTLRTVIENYTSAQAVLQTVSNPSGTLWPAGLGLAEPKFYTNKTRFNGDWGRPQRDGPALRAIAFMDLCDYLLEIGKKSDVTEIYWPLILNDLKYVGEYWNETGYDLWEEVHGNSFFTINSQHRALVQGAKLAKAISVPCKPCKQAPEILCFLSNSFWNETGGYLTADVNVNNVNRSGINTDQILGSIHVFDIDATCDSADFQPCNSKMLATHKVVVDSFRNLYPINKNASSGAVAVGRYPEDTYYGGKLPPV
jgi:glucoamylase